MNIFTKLFRKPEAPLPFETKTVRDSNSISNKECAEIVFKFMRNIGFSPYKIEYSDEYMSFDALPKDSIVEFRVHGVSRHWKFGMWINPYGKVMEDSDDMIELFAQWDTQIDKFKPSRSELLVKIAKWQLDKEVFNDYMLGEMLKFMRRHPLVAYYESDRSWDYNDGSYLGYFLRHEIPVVIKNIRHRILRMVWVPIIKRKVKIGKRNPIIKEIRMSDGWGFEDWTINITFQDDATDEQIDEYLEKWWPRVSYGKYSYYGHIARVGMLWRGKDRFTYA